MIDLLLPPAFIFFLGAIIYAVLPTSIRKWFAIAVPALAFLVITKLDSSASYILPFLDTEINLLRVDAYSKVFGYIFTISAFATCIYAMYLNKKLEIVSAFLYIGSALGVVFTADLLSLYLFWEIMAVTSVMLILARKTAPARKAAMRYIVVHIVGGLILLAGIVLLASETGSLAFTSFTEQSLATWLILIGFLINAAAVPLSSWLPDAYPQATVVGGVVLSAYTSKTAVYTLIRGFPGWDILIYIGCFMAIYGVIYGILENDVRRILAYSIVNQVGFMVVAVGVGTPLALAGATAHAFCHIIYKALLWMSAGAVLYRTGKSKCTELGGLAKYMPLTCAFGLVGALTIGLPFTGGFTTKTITLYAIEYAHLFWPWLILEIASVGVFLNAGIKFPYFIFFAKPSKDKQEKPKEVQTSMLVGMGILATLCIYLGLFPGLLYDQLPNAGVVKKIMSSSFSDIYIHHFSHVATKFQMAIFTAIAFFMLLPIFKKTNSITIDFDWFYRKGWSLFYKTVSTLLNGLNDVAHQFFINNLTKKIGKFSENGPAKLVSSVLRPVWIMAGQNETSVKKNTDNIHKLISSNTFPIGIAAFLAMVFLAFLLL